MGWVKPSLPHLGLWLGLGGPCDPRPSQPLAPSLLSFRLVRGIEWNFAVLLRLDFIRLASHSADASRFVV